MAEDGEPTIPTDRLSESQRARHAELMEMNMRVWPGELLAFIGAYSDPIESENAVAEVVAKWLLGLSAE